MRSTWVADDRYEAAVAQEPYTDAGMPDAAEIAEENRDTERVMREYRASLPPSSEPYIPWGPAHPNFQEPPS